MSEEKKCPICGEPTYLVYGKHPRKDGLCKKHSQMLFNGELAKCSDCGEWYEPLFGCDCKLPENNITINNKKEKNEKQIDQEATCIICKEKTKKGYYFCKDCYYDKNSYYEDLDYLNNLQDAKDYYFNLKNNIFRVKNFEYAQDACLKLYAIAEIIDGFKYCGQQEKAVKDITYLLTKKEEYLNKEANNQKQEENETDEISTEIEDYRKVNPATIHCKDGHYVRSPYEKIIDDTLYNEKIFHEYERRYKALDGRTYYPDFYIPEIDLYIEYFGVNENKQKNLYKKEIFEKDTLHNFAFIWPEQNGILDEIILDLIEKYKRKIQK